MRYVNFIIARLVAALGRKVDQLENQRSSSYDAGASRKEVAANDVLEDGGLAGGLGTYYDL